MPRTIQYIRQIKQNLNYAMIADYYNIARELKDIEQNKFKDATNTFNKLNSLNRILTLSSKRYQIRALSIPPLQYPQNLPISVNKKEIIDGIKNNQVIIITGETG